MFKSSKSDSEEPLGNEKPAATLEQLLTLKDVSTALNVPLFAIRRAAKSGAFPVYRIGNGRARVRISEIVAAVEASKKGGA
jgi:hypothetical protein